jgi:DNA-binding LacI/PurR family transcriptional regulator/serine phosphatase RsbU (regulator of sigma subunit)
MARRRSIALLVDYLGGEYQSGLYRGIESAAEAHDVNLLVVPGRSLADPQGAEALQNDVYEHFGSSCTDGVILASGTLGIYSGPGPLRALCERLGARRCFSIGVNLPGVPSVVVSNRRAMQAVVRHMIDVHGCRRIAHIRGPSASEEAQQRLDGYADALRERAIPFDPDLVEEGNFWMNGGASAAEALLDRAGKLDAMVAANDYMLVGALGVLRGRGLRVPKDLLVAGFDDAPQARIANPSFTTVGQPLMGLARIAVETLLACLDGATVPECIEVEVDVVTRQSCGCERHPANATTMDVPARVRGDEPRRSRPTTLRDQLLLLAPLAASKLPDFAERLLAAIEEEVSGARGRFLAVLDDVLEGLQPHGEAIVQFNALIDELRASYPRWEALWREAADLVCVSVYRSGEVALNHSNAVTERVRQAAERMSSALSHAALAEALREVLPFLDLRSGSVALYEDETRQQLRPLFLFCEPLTCRNQDHPFPSERLAVEGFFPEDRRWSHVVLPLPFGREHFGVAVVEAGADAAVYRMLRGEISGALKGAALHSAVVRQIALRESAEREQLHRETRIAQQIQTAILPRTISVEGLDLAGAMAPATEVGGDYYDVLPTHGGCWIGVGDVMGHGLLAGLLTLMIQGMVAGIVQVDGSAPPRKLLAALNAAFFGNLNDRLLREEHATLLLMKYARDGVLTFAGYHEQVIVFRVNTGLCERLRTQGVWLGVVSDVASMTHDCSTTLSDGDLLVLYTDGVVEALDAHDEEFGIDRLCAIIEAHGADPVAQICSAVLAAVERWAAVQVDDRSILVGRYSARAAAVSTST